MKPAVECVIRPRRPSEDFPSRRAAMSSERLTCSNVAPSANSPGCRMIVEQAEVPVQAHVDARRLDHLRVMRGQPDPAGCEFCLDVAIAEKHAFSLLGLPAHAEIVGSAAVEDPLPVGVGASSRQNLHSTLLCWPDAARHPGL
jgi:hypothetical protein